MSIGWTKERRRDYQREYMRVYRKNNRDKYHAQAAVSRGIRNGTLDRGNACEYCGSQDRIQAHHPSYAEDMRLCVTWLCQPCHNRLHKAKVI